MKRTWIAVAVVFLLSIPILVSVLNHSGDPNESQNKRLNRYSVEEENREYSAQDSSAIEHRIPRKTYYGTNSDINQGNSNAPSKVMDQILAQDLSMTTSLFIKQLEEQLERWSKIDLRNEEAKRRFSEELQKHKQFHSLGLIKDGKLQVQKGKLSEQHLNAVRESKHSTFRSEPYLSAGRQVMMLGRRTGDEWLVGEIDLSFLKGFVGQLASVADANGNFFISSKENKEVKWDSGMKERDNVITQAVPELDWQIVIHSRDEAERQRKHYADGQVLVQFDSEDSAQAWLAAHQEYSVDKRYGSFVVLSHPALNTNQLIDKVALFPEIIRAEPNYIFTKQFLIQNAREKATKKETETEHRNDKREGIRANEEKERKIRLKQEDNQTDHKGQIPNDEFFLPYQWNLERIHAGQGWGLTTGSESLLLAYLDTGVDIDHEDLKDKLVEGYNTFDETNNLTDQHGHGTHVAGIIGAITNNSTGIAGTAWQNPIVPVKVLNENGEGSIFEIASGLIWATDNGAKVINMSLGDSEHSELLYEAIRYAYERDVVLIAAAGNDNVSTPMYPSAYEEVLAVSAVNGDLQKAEFSNYGNHIDVAAPGENIPSTFLDDQYVFMSGTSMAAPHVTGLAGLIRSLRPDLTNDEVMDVIRETATDIGDDGRDPYYGFGLINVQAALEYLQNNKEALQRENQATPFPGIQDWLKGLFQLGR